MHATTRRLATAAAAAILYAACVPDRAPSAPDRISPTFSGTAETPAILLTAGNIGDCNSTRDDATANVLDGQPGTVLTLGDNAFEYGTLANYRNCYAPTWGRQLSRTYATLGNHDYQTGNASGAFAYFGAHIPSSTGYYSVDLGAWHVIVLNDAGQYSPTNSYSPWYSGSPQETWLRNDLVSHAGRCTLVSFHVPLWLSSNSSGYVYNSDHRLIWNDLYAAHVDVVLNAQEHWYERMAPQRPDGTADAAGIREFIVGTAGGDGLIMPTVAIQQNSQVRGATPGVLRMTLYSDHYGWQFLPVAGQAFSDTGSTSCHSASSSSTTPTPPPPPPATTSDTGVVLAGAGNIATCGNTRDDATASLLAGMDGMVFTAGDNAFDHGSSTDYANCYNPTWGRVLARTLPALGNHDYDTGGAAGAFGYFGGRLGSSGYYSTTVGAWHVIVLNDNIAYSSGSAQEQWLRADLAAHPAKCTLAIWHHPRFFSSNYATWHSDTGPLTVWQDLAAAHADVVINGHQYDYERFAPMDPDGTADPAGIREFNVGTGGYASYSPASIAPNSQAVSNAFGVLKLRLFSDHYTWQFVPIAGYSFSDAGTGYCH